MYISSVLAHPQQDFLDPYQFHSFMLTITWSMTCTKTIQQQWHNFSRKSHLHHTKLAGSQKGTIRSRCIHLPPSKRELLGATRTSSTPFASKDTYIYIYMNGSKPGAPTYMFVQMKYRQVNEGILVPRPLYLLITRESW